MHEQSETVTRPSGSVNVYGGTQFPLPKVFGFEKNYYPSQSEAVNAAQWRSRMGGGPEPGHAGYPEAPTYGFKDKPNTNPYAPIVGGAVDALQDPRVGMFPGAGAAGMGFRAVGAKAAKGLTKATAEEGQTHMSGMGLRAANLEREPMTFPGRTPPKDLSLDKAAEDMRQSMGWTGEQLQQWTSKYRR